MLVLLVVATVAGLAVVRLTPLPVTPKAGDRPNIILITSDDQRADDMVAMQRTEELIGDEGTTFDRAYASFPLCCPSRASMLTGQYAHNHGVLGNGGNGIGGFKDFDGSSTLATWLQDAGYSTNFVGKYLNRFGTVRPVEVPPGWDDFRGSLAGGNYFETVLFQNGESQTYDDVNQTDLYAGISSDLITERAADDEPFFLWASFYAPHNGRPSEDDDPVDGIGTPAVAPRHQDVFEGTPLPEDPSFDEQDVSDKPEAVSSQPALPAALQDDLTELHQQRLESLLALDEGIEHMMSALEASGELDNTVIVFTSDNGYMLGEHRIHAGKTVMYEPSARVPLLVRGPGFPVGVTRQQPVALVDLAPTFVDMARATAGLTMDGVSLLPPAQDSEAGTDRVIVIEAGPEEVGQEWNYRGVRNARYVYVEYGESGETELYDMAEDPYQLENLTFSPSAADRQVVADMADLLDALRDCAGTACQP
ncbi:MAG: sulfatase [Geodermatophilaceae bacterium]|nr:sulfatase [Geodermatophilaceae bacterium]